MPEPRLGLAEGVVSRPSAKPNAVLDSFSAFNPDSACEFLASRLECGEYVDVIQMKEASGAGRGCVMKIEFGSDDGRKLDVRVQSGHGRIVGRSSRYDKPD